MPAMHCFHLLKPSNSGDFRDTDSAHTRTMIVRGYDYYDRHRFLCVLYDELTEATSGQRSYCQIGPAEGRWKVWSKDAIRILCVKLSQFLMYLS